MTCFKHSNPSAMSSPHHTFLPFVPSRPIQDSCCLLFSFFLHSVCVSQIVLRVEPAPICGQIARGLHHQKKKKISKPDSPCPSSCQMLTASPLHSGSHVHFPPPMLGIRLAGVCTCLQHAVIITCMCPVVSGNHFLWCYQSWLLLLWRSLGRGGKDVIDMSHLGQSTPQSFISCTLASWGLCVNCHLLQKGAAVMAIERCFDL